LREKVRPIPRFRVATLTCPSRLLSVNLEKVTNPQAFPRAWMMKQADTQHLDAVLS